MPRVRAIIGAIAQSGLLIAVAGSIVRGDTLSDEAAAIVTYPYLVVDTASGRDTVVQLSNALSSPVDVLCVYVNANSHCSATGAVCTSDADCPVGTCVAGWLERDFRITLTAEQPIAWRASQGLAAPPLPSGPISPVSEDPFVGSLQCIVVDASGAPTDQNALTGNATLERALPAAATLDVAKYNAIGTQAIAGANDGNGTLVLGGPAAEYNSCPEVSILEHFFDGAVEPITNTDTVFTTLVLAPCSADYASIQPGAGLVNYLIFNEFEQRFSVSRPFTCLQHGHLSAIDTPVPATSVFSFAVQGTLVGQTRMQSIGSGIYALAIEEQQLALSGRTTSAAHNLHLFAVREAPDVICLPGAPCATNTPTPTETSTPTATSTATLTETPTETLTPTSTETLTPTSTSTNTGTATATATETSGPSSGCCEGFHGSNCQSLAPNACAAGGGTFVPGAECDTKQSGHCVTPTSTPTPLSIPTPTATARGPVFGCCERQTGNKTVCKIANSNGCHGLFIPGGSCDANGQCVPP